MSFYIYIFKTESDERIKSILKYYKIKITNVFLVVNTYIHTYIYIYIYIYTYFSTYLYFTKRVGFFSIRLHHCSSMHEVAPVCVLLLF